MQGVGKGVFEVQRNDRTAARRIGGLESPGCTERSEQRCFIGCYGLIRFLVLGEPLEIVEEVVRTSTDS